MHYESPTVHKLQIGDILCINPACDITIWNDKPVIFLGTKANDRYPDGRIILFYIEDSEIREVDFHPSHLQSMINDGELEVWTDLGNDIE